MICRFDRQQEAGWGAMLSIELNAIDLRLAHTRTRDKTAERRLLPLIAERGIEDPLAVAATEQGGRWVLLDGFKRYRCACKIGLGMVPAQQVGQSVADGMIALLRRDKAGGLSTLEQAALVGELSRHHKMSIYEIAQRLGYSSSWVSMRLGLVEEMSEPVRAKIMTGAFPARAYMYGLKGFTRVKRLDPKEVDTFVEALSGKGFSTREILRLSRAYFAGEGVIRRQVVQGQPRRALKLLRMQENDGGESQREPAQRRLLADLKATALAMARIGADAERATWCEATFRESANLWSETIRKRLQSFSRTIEEVYDRSRATSSGADPSAARGQAQGDSSATADRCEDGSRDRTGGR